jgi:hypothetical protein
LQEAAANYPTVLTNEKISGICGDDGRIEYCYGVCVRYRRGAIVIGPPGLPKMGRRVFAQARTREQQIAWKWVAGLYLAGVLAHFSHHMAFDLPADHIDPSLGVALHSAPTSFVWPADLIETLMDRS